MIFDAILYGSAIVAILSVLARHGRNGKAIATRPTQSIDNTLETLHAIGEALPEDCFSEDEVIAPVMDGTFDCGNNATFFEATAVAEGCAMVNRYWNRPTAVDNVVPFVRPSQPVKLVEYRNNKDLRTKCREAGVSPSVGTGKNRRFLTVAEMVQRLGEAGYEVHCVA